jgi:hypothetical protein
VKILKNQEICTVDSLEDFFVPIRTRCSLITPDSKAHGTRLMKGLSLAHAHRLFHQWNPVIGLRGAALLWLSVCGDLEKRLVLEPVDGGAKKETRKGRKKE